jgi:hypothetical protein
MSSLKPLFENFSHRLALSVAGVVSNLQVNRSPKPTDHLQAGLRPGTPRRTYLGRTHKPENTVAKHLGDGGAA